MPRPLLAFFLLLGLAETARAAQQQPPPSQPQPIPDTKAARDRHRIQEKEPPPPEGPWGPEEFGFTWQNPVWRGLVITGGPYGGNSLNLNVPDGLAAFSDGVNPPVFESLEWEQESFRSDSITIAADLDMFRLSVSYFDGTFSAQGILVHTNGVTETRTPVDFNGDAYGFRFGAYWPTLRYRDWNFEASLGAAVSVGWLHEETFVPGGVLLARDEVDVLTGSFGPKASFRALFLGNIEVEVDAEYSFMTGAVRGWTKEFSAGIGIHF
ncbi:MAG TPA: hypothetical protein VE981_05720 [Planctomycetota bacterium]|nr:hypothetical protein [Planctomycetota bacterium]